MPDIIGQILQRLDALEAAVHGRASEHFDRKLFKPEVAFREGVVARTIERNVAAEKFPPPDGVTNGHAWWWFSTLERHDRAVAAKPATTRTPPNAGKEKPRQQKDQVAANTNTLEEAAAPLRPMGSGRFSEAFAAEHRSSPTEDRVTGEPNAPPPTTTAGSRCRQRRQDRIRSAVGRMPHPQDTDATQRLCNMPGQSARLRRKVGHSAPDQNDAPQ
jgi:hypothetical protein